MPPHGRRRLGSLTVYFGLFCFFLSTVSAVSAVLGIDLGTEYIKAALVKPGIPLEIVLTKDSKRKETAAVAFKPLRSKVNTVESDSYPERAYGGDAVALSARYPSDVYPNLKPLLGLPLSDDLVKEYGNTHTGLRMVETETGTTGFESDSFVPEEVEWSVEELIAMELKNIKGNAENMAGKGTTILDVVLTVPSFYTVEERRAVIAAADLAGLRVLSLISDGLSVGLNYATSRTFPTINDGAKPEIHLVYDMGAGSTSATILKFQGRTVKDIGKYNKTVQEVQVLGTGWDRSLGGDALNRVILNDMVDKFADENHMLNLKVMPKDVRAHGRTMAKLWKESERIRQVLSANTETSASFESLYHDDFTFKYKLSRSDFEKMTSTYLDRVQKPIEDALESAKLTYSDLDSIILHGGTIRTPFVQKQLEIAIKDPEKVRTNVNGDEAAVFGAAFKAAGISPSFRVKEIRAADTAVYPVSMTWAIDSKEKRQKLFVPTSQVGAEKQVSVKALDDFSFILGQQTSSEQSENLVSITQTKNLTDSVKMLTDKFGCLPSNISTRFAIRLSPIDAIPEVVSGSASCEVSSETEPKKGGVVEGVKDLFGFGAKKVDQEPLKEDSKTDSSSSLNSETEKSTTASISSTTESQTTASATEDANQEAKPKEMKKRTETVQISFSTATKESSENKFASVDRMKKRLTAFDKSDRSRVIREEILNTLEGYTYKIRDMVEEEGFVAASSSAQRDEIENKSNEASIWLYGDGADAPRGVLKQKLDELRGLIEPIQKRREEAKARPDAVQRLKDALEQADTMVKVINQQTEAQASAASEAASQTSESLSSFEAHKTTASSGSTDEFAELDDEPVTSSASPPPAAPTMAAPLISEEDINNILGRREAIQNWLDEKLAEQDKLSPTDDPAVLSADISAKSQEIQDAVMNLLTKSMKPPPKPKAKKPKPKVSKSTSASATSATFEEAGASASVTLNPSAGLREDFEDLKITQEEIDVAKAEQKAKAEKTKKSAKPKTSTKSKSNAKSKGKAKSKPKGNDKKKPDIKEEL